MGIFVILGAAAANLVFHAAGAFITILIQTSCHNGPTTMTTNTAMMGLVKLCILDNIISPHNKEGIELFQ